MALFFFEEVYGMLFQTPGRPLVGLFGGANRCATIELFGKVLFYYLCLPDNGTLFQTPGAPAF